MARNFNSISDMSKEFYEPQEHEHLEDMKKGDVPLLSLDNDLSEEIPELQRLLNRSESPPNIGKSPIKDIPPQPNQTEPSEPRRSARSPSRTNPYDPEKEAAKPQLAETPKPRNSVADSLASILTGNKHLDTLPKSCSDKDKELLQINITEILACYSYDTPSKNKPKKAQDIPRLGDEVFKNPGWGTLDMKAVVERINQSYVLDKGDPPYSTYVYDVLVQYPNGKSDTLTLSHTIIQHGLVIYGETKNALDNKLGKYLGYTNNVGGIFCLRIGDIDEDSYNIQYMKNSDLLQKWWCNSNSCQYNTNTTIFNQLLEVGRVFMNKNTNQKMVKIKFKRQRETKDFESEYYTIYTNDICYAWKKGEFNNLFKKYIKGLTDSQLFVE